MRLLALASGSLVAFVATTQDPYLPPALAKSFATLAAAPSVTVVYTVTPAGGAAIPYTLVLGRPKAFRLTTPTGFVLSDGKTVTTYVSATKIYREEALTENWLATFARRPEIMPWAPFFQEKPALEFVSVGGGAPRAIGGFETDTVTFEPKRGPGGSLFIDKKLGVVRAAFLGPSANPIVVQAKTIEVGTAPLKPDAFAFVVPQGAQKEAVLFRETFEGVKTIIDDRCMPCHSTGRHSAGVVLDTYEGVKATVVPSDPKTSLLIKSVRGDGVRLMPLGNHPKLTEDEIKGWEAWIVAGAKKD